jgi:hypothetical protein
MCQPISNFSQKIGIFKKFEIMLQVILRYSCFSKSIDKSSNQTFNIGNIGMSKIGTFSNFKVFVWVFHAEHKICGFYFSSYNYSQPYEENSCQRNFSFDLSFSLGMLLKVSENTKFKKIWFSRSFKKNPSE